MIKINEQFSLKNYSGGYELHHVTPSDSPQSKTGLSTKITFHPSLRLAGLALITKSSGHCKTGQELVDHIDAASALFVEKLGGK